MYLLKIPLSCYISNNINNISVNILGPNTFVVSKQPAVYQMTLCFLLQKLKGPLGPLGPPGADGPIVSRQRLTKVLYYKVLKKTMMKLT